MSITYTSTEEQMSPSDTDDTTMKHARHDTTCHSAMSTKCKCV